MIFDNISTDHLRVFQLQPFSHNDPEFFLFGRDYEEKSIIEIFFTDSILIEDFYTNINKFISFTMREKNCYHLFGGFLFMRGKKEIKSIFLIFGEDTRKVIHIVCKMRDFERIHKRYKKIFFDYRGFHPFLQKSKQYSREKGSSDSDFTF